MAGINICMLHCVHVLLGLICAVVAGNIGTSNAMELRSWVEAEAMADNTLQQMTPYERHMLMQGTGWTPNPAGAQLFPVLSPGMYMGNTPAIPRLGIPALKLADAGNGFRNNPMGAVTTWGTATSFPSALALAASWDDELVRRSAHAIGEEFRDKGANVILGPGVQVHRVARNGRNFEYISGEDPYIGVRLSAAYIQAVQATGVMACAKHYAFNDQELSRFDSSSNVDEKTAWEIYYPPFEASVKAGVGSFMCGYNQVNGTWDCENHKLLSIDLKGKMGFRGFVMSDWFATHSPSVLAGLDQNMPGVEPWFTHAMLECMETGKGCNELGKQKSKMEEAWDKLSGALGMKDDLNAPDAPGTFRDYKYRDAARRILVATYRNRIDQNPGCSLGEGCVRSLVASVRSTQHEKVAEEGATQSVVLLKNLGSLPIDPKKVRTIFLAGLTDPDPVHTGEGMPPADYYSGGGSGHTSADTWVVQKARISIERRAKQDGIEIESQSSVGAFDTARFYEQCRKADLRIYIGGTTASEGWDRATLFLDQHANEYIGQFAECGPTVVLLQTPGAVVLPWRNHPNISAIMNMFLGGEKTGKAWANTLFGDITPSGKLPILFPKTADNTVEPSQDKSIPYTEGMFGSYRSPQAEEISAYPFGHGLSYTTFGYGKPKQTALSMCENVNYAWKGFSPLKACVVMNVTNTGMRSGAEVAQAYLEFAAETRMPKLMLKGFYKTSVIIPGTSELAAFAFTERDLSTYHVETGRWELLGTVKLHVAASSIDLRGSATVKVDAEGAALLADNNVEL